MTSQKSPYSNLELEGQGRGIIMGATRPLVLGPFYYVLSHQTILPTVYMSFRLIFSKMVR